MPAKPPVLPRAMATSRVALRKPMATSEGLAGAGRGWQETWLRDGTVFARNGNIRDVGPVASA